MSAATVPHPFLVWLREQYAVAETPLGDFTRKVADELPSTGSRVELRAALQVAVSGLPPGTAKRHLDCFDVAWVQWATCEAPRCREAVAHRESFCEAHAGAAAASAADYREQARRAWPAARWVLGDGPYATVRDCDGVTVLLHATRADAEKALKTIHPPGAQRRCRLRHELVVLSGGAT